MEPSQRIMTIGKNDVVVTDTELNQADLLFYPENPRVFTALRALSDTIPSQELIEKTMCRQENVKQLKVSIEANGSLLEPIIVRKNIVLEGNSRLAAYRLLARIDSIKWGKIKCTVLPDDTSDELVFNLLGTIHIIGRTPWSPFEQAGYLYRTKNKSRRPIEAIANDLGMKCADARLYLKVYQKMMDEEDMQPTRWSYYFELFKNKHILKANENNPEMNVLDTIVQKIKDDKFEDAREIRKVAELAKVQTEEGKGVLAEFLDDNIDLDDACDLVSDENVAQTISIKVERFLSFISENDSSIRSQMKQDSDFNMLIKQIHNSLGNYLRIK